MLFAVAAELLSWPAAAQTHAELNVEPEQKIHKCWRSCHQSLQTSTVIRSQQPSLQGDAADALDLCTVSL